MAETTLLRGTGLVRNASPNVTGSRPQAQLSGAHPVVQVNMSAGGPQQQGQAQLRQGVTILPPKGGTRKFTTGGLPNQGAKSSVVISAPKDPRYAAAAAAIQGQVATGQLQTQLTADQLLLCRHLVDKYVSDAKTSVGDAEPEETVANNIKLGGETLTAIDGALAAITAAAALEAEAAAAEVEAPAPARVPPRRVISTGARNASVNASPRRVARPAPPPVVVQMDGKQPVLQQTPPQQDDSTPESAA